MPFYESLRTALARYSAFVHTAEKPASASALAEATARLGRPLPSSYRDFLTSFNGVLLFHEAIILHPIAAVRTTGPDDRYLLIGDTADGELWLDAAARIHLVDTTAPDPIVCGSEIERWLDATLGREALVLDREGEFREVFEDQGEGLTVAVRRKRAQVGAKRDPGAALYLLEQAELLCEDMELDAARLLLQKAVALDPAAGPAWELLGALLQKLGQLDAAEHASLQAATSTWDPFLRASRLLDAATRAFQQAAHPTATPSSERAAPSSERAAAHAAAAATADPDHAQRLLDDARELLEQGGRHVEEAQHLIQRVQLLVTHGPHPNQSPPDLDRLERDLRTRTALRIV